VCCTLLLLLAVVAGSGVILRLLKLHCLLRKCICWMLLVHVLLLRLERGSLLLLLLLL
jgi:hypothetical protein